jgi:predicted Rossmann fold flavoprotein
MQHFDVAVVGAGAAGMMCAGVAGQRGKRVVLIEHRDSPGEKIRISGGGRCNFTNLNAGPDNFVSANPRFCRSALAGYAPSDFISLVRKHRIDFHEKHRGQLFCDGPATAIVDMLRDECATGGVQWRLGTRVEAVQRETAGFVLDTNAGQIRARSVVVSTGGLSIPKAGATDFAYRIARQFGLKVIEPRPGLVPLVFETSIAAGFSELAGVSLEIDIACRGPFGRGAFREDLLFTHKGISGPAGLQISNYWQPGGEIEVNLTPGFDWDALIAEKGRVRGNATSMLATRLPRRVAEHWGAIGMPAELSQRVVADLPDKVLRAFAARVSAWNAPVSGTEGFRKAEVTLGGIDTRELSSRALEANRIPGLHFIGEAVDVTGWLGGYNFQWAWASAVACARAL